MWFWPSMVKTNIFLKQKKFHNQTFKFPHTITQLSRCAKVLSKSYDHHVCKNCVTLSESFLPFHFVKIYFPKSKGCPKGKTKVNVLNWSATVKMWGLDVFSLSWAARREKWIRLQPHSTELPASRACVFFLNRDLFEPYTSQ
jgi:ribosomal protein L32